MAGDVSVVLCRGCCCGTDKHPGADHDRQVEVLRAAATRLWTVDCLGPCERSNVVVVRGDEGRRWFGEVLTPADDHALAGWIRAGAAGPPPSRLLARQFSPDDAPTLPGERLALTPDEIANLVHDIVTDGTWWFGRPGAAAECVLAGATVERHGREVTAVGDGAAVRLVVPDDAAVFRVANDSLTRALLFAVPHEPVGSDRVVMHGVDTDAIRLEDRRNVLVELVEGFAVRADGSLHHVLTHPLGRAEVYASTGDASNAHLDPGELEVGRTLPVGFSLPPGLTLAALWFSPPGWMSPFAPTGRSVSPAPGRRRRPPTS